MSIFKRKQDKSDISLEERRMENIRATEKLLNALSSGSKQFERWQDEIRGMKNERKPVH